MAFQGLPLVTEHTAKTIQHLVDFRAEETSPLQKALVRYRDLLRQSPSVVQVSEAADHRKQLNVTLQRIRVKFHKLRRAHVEVARRYTKADGAPEEVSRRLPEVLLAYLVSQVFGLMFQVEATDLRWNPREAKTFWWMRVRVADADGKAYEYEETSPVYAVDIFDPSQMEAVSQVPLYLLWMDLFLHGMRLAVPQLPWDDWMDSR